MSTSWATRWGYELSTEPVRPCIYRLKTGGYLIRVKVNGKPRLRVLPSASLVEAAREVVRLRDEVEKLSMPLWRTFAVSLFKERVMRGTINSAATRERWSDTLEHYLIPAFGEMPVDEVTHLTIVEWTNEVARWIRHGKPSLKDPKKNSTVSASSANGWLRILRTICNVMTVRHKLEHNPFDGVTFFPEPEVYTDENPNSLTPAKTRQWLTIASNRYPQHYAFMVLGFVTGRRPGELRALRRVEDVDWVNGKVRIRRSHSRGTEIANRTKTKVSTTMHVPKQVMDILKEHIQALPPGPMRNSPLLFPSTTGGIRSRSGLDKPFRSIEKEMGLPEGFLTPRGMRRSFQDLMRNLGVEGFVTRSISGHRTEKMQEHYSTVNAEEQRAALERALGAVEGK